MNIEKARDYLKKESEVRNSLIINNHEFMVLSEFVTMATEISLESARIIAKEFPGATFGVGKNKNPDEVATSRQFESCIDQIKGLPVSEEFKQKEEENLRRRLVEYYDNKKISPQLLVSLVNIHTNEDLKCFIEFIKEL